MLNNKIISFSELEIENKFNTKEIEVNGKKIQVLEHIPSKDAYDLIMITLQQSKQDGIYNPFLIQMFLEINIVSVYTNIVFSDEDRLDYFALYDKLQNSGLIIDVISTIQEEYSMLCDYVEETINAYEKYNHSIGSIVEKVIQDLPKQAEAAKEIIDSFDKDKYQQVLDFAKQANGNRDITTNS